MNISLEALDQSLRASGALAIAYRSPREPDSGGIGMTVSLFYHLDAYVVSIEKFKDDGGYGQNLSRMEYSFDNLKDALYEITQNGVDIDQLKLQ